MDSEDFNGAGTAHQSGVSRPGETLRAAREARRLDLPHIAAETRIPLRHLEAIEAGDFESLPSRAYAIGFSRTYAKAVGLDAAEITDAVRAELAEGSMRRTVPSPAMEPGDPARLPSAGLAWAMAGAVVLLAIGVFAFYNSYFAPGSEPGSLLAPTPAPTTPAPVARAVPAATVAPSGPVVLTATEDGVWVRIYEEGGARLTERTLMRGETVEVPVTAADPRINTARPDALSVTIGGQPAPRLSDMPQTISGVPVSAAALAARGTGSVVPGPQATPAARGVRRRVPQDAAPAPTTAAGEITPGGSDDAPAPASEPATAPRR